MAPVHPDPLAPAPIDPSAAAGVSQRPTASPRQGGAATSGGGGVDVGMLLQKVALAGMSNMIAACVTNPFDLIKVRQQLQRKAGGGSTVWYRTLIDMVRSEGTFSVYKGLSASLLREGSYSGIRMGAYDLCKTAVLKINPYANEGSFGTKLAAGMASGCVGAAIANPADLLKVRMQSAGATGSLRYHASTILETKGVAGLYRAVFPTMIRAGILTSSQLGVYDHAKHTLMDDFPTLFREGFWTHFAASGVAGFACSAASSPVDIVKVRMMTDTTSQYRNALHCAAVVLQNEGPLAFYKGFTMCFLRLWPHSVLSLLAFEYLRRVTGLSPI